MVFSFHGITMDIDLEKTRAYYADRPTVRHTCSCGGCQNYDKAILTAPKSVLAFFEQLGLDPQKPCEAFGLDLKPDENGWYRYGGWYHVVGQLLEAADREVSIESAYRPALDYEFMVWFSDDKRKFGPVSRDFPTPIIALSFQICLPWLPD